MAKATTDKVTAEILQQEEPCRTWQLEAKEIRRQAQGLLDKADAKERRIRLYIAEEIERRRQSPRMLTDLTDSGTRH